MTFHPKFSRAFTVLFDVFPWSYIIVPFWIKKSGKRGIRCCIVVIDLWFPGWIIWAKGCSSYFETKREIKLLFPPILCIMPFFSNWTCIPMCNYWGHIISQKFTFFLKYSQELQKMHLCQFLLETFLRVLGEMWHLSRFTFLLLLWQQNRSIASTMRIFVAIDHKTVTSIVNANHPFVWYSTLLLSLHQDHHLFCKGW